MMYFNDYYTNHPMNLRETSDSWIIELRAVGLNKEDISVNYDPEGYLKIKSITKKDLEKEKTLYNRTEFRADHFDTFLQLPTGIDSENISATVNSGILIITVGKDKTKGQKMIEVK